jgi:hypothetical protein
VILEQSQQYKVMATPKKIKVEDAPSLERDSFSNAILNSDTAAYNAVINRKKRMRNQERLIAELHKKVEELLQWKSEITAMLQKKENK